MINITNITHVDLKQDDSGGEKRDDKMESMTPTVPSFAAASVLLNPLSLSNPIDSLKHESLTLQKTLHDYQLLCQVWDQSISTFKSRLMQYASFRATWFLQLDTHFQTIWTHWQAIPSTDQPTLKQWLFDLFESTTLLKSEINDHIVNQPFGYPGDFKSIEYLYDYYGDFLGNSMYEVFLNDYTTNIPIAHSTYLRKHHLKTLLRDHINQTPSAHVVSIGSGGGREIIELLQDGGTPPAHITCIDFDPLAIETLQQRINALPHNHLHGVTTHFWLQDIRQLMRNTPPFATIPTYIYAAGLSDYLSDSVCKRLLHYLFKLIAPNGQVLICNANRYSEFHRVYYELLGSWNLIFRDKESLLAMSVGLDASSTHIINPIDANNTHDYLCLTKSAG